MSNIGSQPTGRMHVFGLGLSPTHTRGVLIFKAKVPSLLSVNPVDMSLLWRVRCERNQDRQTDSQPCECFFFKQGLVALLAPPYARTTLYLVIKMPLSSLSTEHKANL